MNNKHHINDIIVVICVILVLILYLLFLIKCGLLLID
jgi:hypothetical protein